MNKIKFTSQNPFQREIDMFYWSLEIIKAFDKGELSYKEIDELNEMGFNWGYYRQRLIESERQS